MRPTALKSGDKVAVVAPAGIVHNIDLESGLALLQDWGLDVEIGPHVFEGSGFFSATDEKRLSDLQEAIDRTDIKAIFCARGGYGVGRYLDELRLDSLIDFPKWIVGFSDVTLLHFKLHGKGICSIHGPMVKQFGRSVDEASTAGLKEILFGNQELSYEVTGHSLNVIGSTNGVLIGGNLSLVANNIGTSTDTDFSNKILFVEEVNEPIYAIDRLFNQLKRCGKLSNLAGLILGQFRGIKQSTPAYSQNAYQVVAKTVTDYEYPVLYNFPAGHGEENRPLLFSTNCQMIVEKDKSFLKFNR